MTTAPKATKMNTGTSAEPSECFAKAILLLLTDCDKCGQEASRIITNVIIFAWGALLAWFIVEMYRTYKYRSRYVTSIDGYRNKLILKSSSTEEGNAVHDKTLNKKGGK